MDFIKVTDSNWGISIFVIIFSWKFTFVNKMWNFCCDLVEKTCTNKANLTDPSTALKTFLEIFACVICKVGLRTWNNRKEHCLFKKGQCSKRSSVKGSRKWSCMRSSWLNTYHTKLCRESQQSRYRQVQASLFNPLFTLFWISCTPRLLLHICFP